MRTFEELKKSYPWISELNDAEVNTLTQILGSTEASGLPAPSMFGGDSLREDYGVAFQVEWVEKTSFCSITVNPEGEENLYEFFYLNIESNETKNLDTDNLSEVLALLGEVGSRDFGKGS